MGEEKQARPYISVYFKCCRRYQRIYLNKGGTAFVGWCPKCCGKVEVLVSPDGTTNIFFEAK
jgi:hypothetical protein